MEKKVQIIIPKADEKEVATVPSGEMGDIRKKFEKIDQILFGVMLAVVLSLVAIIVSVVSLFLDQMRYNNAAYRECKEIKYWNCLKNNYAIFSCLNYDLSD